MQRRAGFTLLEICLALFVALLLITLAAPAIGSVLAEQRLKRGFDEFDRFVRKAREKSMTERRTYAMAWADDGITLLPTEHRDTDDPAAEPERFLFAKGESIALERPSALMKKPPGEWVFWRSGLCEEVVVSFAGDAGTWNVHYDPLTTHGTFLDSTLK